MKSRRSKCCDIPKSVKDTVWIRDRHMCIFCKSQNAYPNAHYIPRSKGGLGIEQNVVTACLECHRKMDQGVKLVRAEMIALAKQYLEKKYPTFENEGRFYKK